MRTIIVALVIVLVVIFVGGSLRVGGDSIFGHVDSVVGAPVLTGIYRTLFFFLYKGVTTVESEVSKTSEDLKEFQERPLGIDKKKTYRQLDDAAKH
jgi:hypothetical protein